MQAARAVRSSKTPASLACTECRRQHVKCDAGQPTCRRCDQTALSCQYLPSRRGGRRKPNQEASINSSRRESGIHTSPIQHQTPIARRHVASYTPRAQPSTSSHNDAAGVAASIPNATTIDTPSLPQSSVMNLFSDADMVGGQQDDRLVRLFYENFHVSHPILVPAAAYQSRDYPQFLQTVVKFIGSHYSPSGHSRTLKDSVDSALAVSQDRTSCMVMARLLYAISLYANDERPKALEAYSGAVELATAIGMHRRDFVSSSDPIEAESLRRTWWELYLVDIFMNISSTPISFRCNVPAPEVALPCEESVYARSLEIPEPAQFLEFKSRIFAAEETVFSSFSYRIEAMMILCRALLLNQIRDPHRDHLQAVENALVSWVNHLPAKKLDIVDAYGNVDEMMFQAHIIIAYAAMLIHLPRSELRRLLVPQEVGCWPCTLETLQPTFSRAVHSIKSTEASRRVSDFISICPNIQKHSPLVIPALGLCGMIQLATSVSHSEECFDHHYNRVTLVLGCLRVMRRTWVSADMAHNRVRTCAAKMLSDLTSTKWTPKPSEKRTTPQQPSHNPDEINGAFRHVPDNQPQLLAAFAQEFIDPTCYDTSIFNAFGDFDMNI